MNLFSDAIFVCLFLKPFFDAVFQCCFLTVSNTISKAVLLMVFFQKLFPTLFLMPFSYTNFLTLNMLLSLITI
jgi:hypothetical protein